MANHLKRVFNGIGAIGFIFWLLGTLSIIIGFLLSFLHINVLGVLFTGVMLFGVVLTTLILYFLGWIVEKLKI